MKEEPLDLQPDIIMEEEDPPCVQDSESEEESLESEDASLSDSSDTIQITGKRQYPKKIRCNVCKKMTARSTIFRHMRTKHDKHIKCSFKLCGFYFGSEAELQEHEKQVHHVIKESGTLKKQSEKVSKDNEVKATAQSGGKAMKVQCYICDRALSRYYLSEHLKCRHNLKFKCSFSKCINQFLTEADRQQHEEEMHPDDAASTEEEDGSEKTEFPEKFKCYVCNQKTSRKHISRHMKSKHSKHVKCSFKRCVFYFDSEADRHKHEKKFHGIGDTSDFKSLREKVIKRKPADKPKGSGKIPKIQCYICDRVMTKYYLADHLKCMHDLHYKCRFTKCAGQFATDVERQHHEKKVHPDDVITPPMERVKCIYCQRTFANIGGKLNMHMKQYHKKQAIRCNFHKLCLEYFLTEADRQEHIRNIHVALRVESQCMYCNKTYKNSYIARAHIRSQHKTVSIKCKYVGCGRYFLKQDECDEHYSQVHEKKEQLKRFQCNECDYKSNYKQTWLMHIKTNHTKSTLNCPKCSKVFFTRENLNKHINFIHIELFTCDFCGMKMRKHPLRRHLEEGSCKGTA